MRQAEKKKKLGDRLSLRQNLFRFRKAGPLVGLKQGAISLEAAVALPPVLLFVLAWVILLVGTEAGIAWQGAIYKTGRELGVLKTYSPEELTGGAGVFKGDSLSPRSGQGSEYAALARGALNSQLTGPVLGGMVSAWFELGTENKPYLRKYVLEQRLLMKQDAGKNVYRLKSYYVQPAIFLLPSCRASTDIGDWSLQGGLHGRTASTGKLDDDNIWSAGNFVRGNYFREKAGANLPPSYPVIASFSGGTATAVKSIDLTAPYYQNPAAVAQKLDGHIKELQDFCGSDRPWGQAKVHIRSQDVKYRVLELIVPENSPEPLLLFLNTKLREAGRKGVILRIKKKGVSRRYEEPGGESCAETAVLSEPAP